MNALIQTPGQFMAQNGGIPAGPNVTQILLANNMDVQALRTNATTLLPKLAGERLDAAIARVARARMNAMADLRNAGLFVPNGGIGTKLHEYQRMSDTGTATVSMDPAAMGSRDRNEFDTVATPVPIISCPFSFSIRDLDAARQRGVALDTTQAESATRRVIEAIENMIINGHSITVSSASIYGYRSAPHRVTGTATGPWNDPQAGAGNIIKTIAAMLAAASAVNHFGPFVLYVSNAEYELFEQPLDVTNYNKSVREYVLANPRISAIKPTLSMTAGECAMVELTSETVDMSLGVDVMMIPWNEYAGLVSHYMVMACMAPRVKSDFNDQCGVVHYTGLAA